MAMNDWQIGLVGHLDGTKSRQQLNNDINALKRQLNSVELKATLSSNQIKSLENQLSKLQVSLTDVNIPKSVLDGLVSQINNALSGIQIPNISLGGQTANQARQAGQQIGNIVSDEVNNALGKVTSKEIGIGFTVEKTASDEFNNAVDEEIRKLQQANNKLNSVRYTTNTERQEVTDIFGNVDYEHVEKLTGAVFRYNTETGEAITKTMKWAQIGMTVDDKGNDVPLMGWVQGLTTYNKSLDESSVKTDTFVDKQKTAVTNLSNQLATIESKFNSSKKPLSDVYDIAQVENKIFDVRKAIDALSTSSKSGFTDAKNAVSTEITELNNLITTLQNAEYAATSLRTKDIKTVKADEENNLNTFVEKMKQSGHYTDKLEQDVASLRKQLNGVFDASTLTTYLNGLSNLQSEFKAVDAAAKTVEKATKVQTNVEAEKKILTLYKNELKEAGVLTGDVKQKIQDMFHSLSKVDSQNGLTTWRAELKGIKAETDAVLKSVQSSSVKEQDAYEVAYKELKKLYDLKIEYAKLGSNKETDFYYGKAIADQEKVWRQAWSKTSEPDNWNVQKRNELHREELVLQDKLAQAYGKTANARKQAEDVNKIQLSTDITKIENDYKRFGIVSQEVENNLKELKIARENALKAEGTDRASAEIEKYNQKLAETKSSWKELQATQVSVNQRTSQMTEMQEWMRKNQKATKLCGDQVQKLIQECQTCNKVRFDQIKNEFKELQVEAGKAGKLGNTFFGGIIEEGKKFLQWTSVTGVIMSFSDEIRHAVGELKDLDSILTEISKTSDLTEKQLKRLGETSLDSASKYGKKASELLTGVQEMYRAGFNNAEEMAELSLLAQSAGDMEATASNDYLLATNAAYDFKGSVEQLTDVLNRQNFITNNAAVSMQDMADATSQAASIAAQYGVEVDELSALIGVAVSKTRESGAEVGTALKALLINLQDTTSKPIREAFDAVGISMTKLVNGSEQLKTPVELLKELASAYNSLPEGDVKRANILNDIGGKHHANTLSAVLSSMDSLNEMLDLYHSNLADGSAYKEAMKSANNWEGSLNRLSNSFTDLVQNFADSDAIIGTINLINGLIKGIDTLSESVGVFGTIGIGTLGFLGAKGHGLTNYVTIS